MKKKILLSLMYAWSFSSVSAQAGMWTWMKGDSLYNNDGTWGIQGIPDTLNNPPGLYGPIKWTDKDGNFWFFGGVDLNHDVASAMWKFSPATNEWTWIRGSQSCCQAGEYGTKGIPSTSNYPGSRGWGAASWTDTSGNFWLFGGTGYSSNGSLIALNDLWKYTPATNEWTWMKGNSSGPIPVYGSQGIPDIDNTPGPKYEVTANITDSKNQLWHYSGFRSPCANCPDDLWRYNITTNEWTWMKGSNSGILDPVYGTKGVFSANNTPGSRENYAGWSDSSDRLWFFGGNLLTTGSMTNDFWVFDQDLAQWAWMGGTNVQDDTGNYSGYCFSDSSSLPKSRWENRATWIDPSGKFWMFGGVYSGGSSLNDLWYYDLKTNSWIWTSGSSEINQVGYYGSQGIAGINNVPPSRYGAVSWIDQQCNLWLFGGLTLLPYKKNDLWKYTPETICGACYAKPSSKFVVIDSNVCPGDCIDFLDLSTNSPNSWQWIFNGALPSVSFAKNPENICYLTTDSFDVTLITGNSYGNDTITLTNYIIVNPLPVTPLITQNADTLLCSNAYSYQWQLNSADIPGATNQALIATQAGLYTVIITDSLGCQNSSGIKFIPLGGIDEFSAQTLTLYPNPSSGSFTLELLNGSIGKKISLSVVNTLSQEIFSLEELISSSHFKREIELNDFEQGIYFIEIKSEQIFLREKILIIR